MNFHEHSIYAASYSGPGERFDVLRQAAGCMTQPTWQLQRMGYVENHGNPELAHNRKRSHINDEIVVAKTDAALSQHYAIAPCGARFLNDVPRILRRQELAFLNVNGAA